ncbi:MAG: type III-B CRISPR module-associated protein Cmr3, partial [Planctomycetota bacterium]
IMYQAVPAGSTYYFRFLKGDPANLAKLQGKSLSEKRSKEGFGLAFWGLDKIQE